MSYDKDTRDSLLQLYRNKEVLTERIKVISETLQKSCTHEIIAEIEQYGELVFSIRARICTHCGYEENYMNSAGLRKLWWDWSGSKIEKLKDIDQFWRYRKIRPLKTIEVIAE